MYIPVYEHIYMRANLYFHKHICVFTYSYVYIQIQLYIYTYIYTQAERNAVIKVLEDSGIDTTGLLLDTSITDEDSVLYQDLAEAVVKLREKFMTSNNSKTTEKMAEKVSSLQEAGIYIHVYSYIRICTFLHAYIYV